MMARGKIMPLDEAMARVVNGTRLMMGEFVGVAEPAKCIEWMLEKRVRDLTLITVTPGLKGGFLMGRLFEQGQISELISTHVATSDESSEAYLQGNLKVRQFFPMGTWAEKVRAGAVGLGGILVPVGISILDQPGIFPDLEEPKQKLTLNGREYFVEEALRAQVSIIKGWRADPLGNVEFRHTSLQNQRDIAMAGDFTIAEVNEIVPVGTIPPDRVGCPGPFVQAVVQGHSLEEQHELYRNHWIKIGRLAPVAR
ncbi:CoA transferase subunit A [Polyangium jinanense]|uniref:CoA transferase subunit A n=2 Tax=Polyangium jinanense TaxID=2829994 RepID=A0A9X4AX91_9BACT|nr:CoA-transferase [Polyangium jinanense]MDC3961717.1 CoA transferase subunit A [Polyangium jinanense]MDC3988223.1 CoA transferase subunit A [Polyangium jinanense]